MTAAGNGRGVGAYRRRLSGGAASSLPPNLALQVDEFNREMEALFGVDCGGQGEFSPRFSSAQSLPSNPGAASALNDGQVHAGTSSSSRNNEARTTPPPPPRAATHELNRIERSIDSACSSGQLTERERRYLRLMLRNSDQQLLRFADLHQPPAPNAHASLLPAAGLLDVLDERISQALLQQYGVP